MAEVRPTSPATRGGCGDGRGDAPRDQFVGQLFTRSHV